MLHIYIYIYIYDISRLRVKRQKASTSELQSPLNLKWPIPVWVWHTGTLLYLCRCDTLAPFYTCVGVTHWHPSIPVWVWHTGTLLYLCGCDTLAPFYTCVGVTHWHPSLRWNSIMLLSDFRFKYKYRNLHAKSCSYRSRARMQSYGTRMPELTAYGLIFYRNGVLSENFGASQYVGFRAFSSVVRQMPGYISQRRGTFRTLPN